MRRLIRFFGLLVAILATILALGTAASFAAVTPSVGATQDYSCGLSDAGVLSCWGSNQWGQLGRLDNLATVTANPTPAPVQGLPAIQQFAAAINHLCALSTASRVYCWGVNFSGQQGNATNNGSFVADHTPQEVTGLPDVVKVTAGIDHNCAISVGGAVYCWGSNEKGQLGNSTNFGLGSANPVPAVVALPAAAVDVAAATKSTCALLVDGTAYCWGYNEYGELANVSFSGVMIGTYTPLPAAVGGVTSLAAPAFGYNHRCGIAAAGQVKCWGWNGAGQLGNAANYTTATPNIAALDANPVGARAVATGAGNSCALLADRTVSCWGQNDNGQNGNSGLGGPAAVTVAGLNHVFAVGAGLWHTCGMERGGGVKCFGSNGIGQLGSSVDLGVVAPHPTPAAVAGLDLVTTAYAPSNVILRLNSSHPVHRGKTSNAPITFLMQPNEIVDPAEACTGKVTVTSYYMKKRKNKRKRLRKRVRRSASLQVKNIGGVDNCVARTTIKLPFRAVKGKRQKFTASFAGNGSVTPVSAKFKARMPRR